MSEKHVARDPSMPCKQMHYGDNSEGYPTQHKPQHDSNGHPQHVSVSFRPLSFNTGWLFAWRDPPFQLDKDDGVKYGQPYNGHVKKYNGYR